jgi:heme a synthase
VSAHPTSTPLARVRRIEVSPAGFRRAALASAGMLIVIVATGATVRLTASGLGCEHWPGCQPGEPLPRNGVHSYVEFSNRIVAFFTLVATLVAWLAATRAPSVSPRTRRLAGAVFFGVILQAALGPVTVHYHLNPWLVLAHLLLSLVVLAGGVLVALDAFDRPVASVRRDVRRGALLVLAALCALLVSGTIVTGSGPHPGGAETKRLPWFESALWVHVRATAVFGIALALLVVWAWRRGGWIRSGALIVLALFLCQMAIGETQYRLRLPWGLVLVHVTVAACVWAASVAFVASLWRARTEPSAGA